MPGLLQRFANLLLPSQLIQPKSINKIKRDEAAVADQEHDSITAEALPEDSQSANQKNSRKRKAQDQRESLSAKKQCSSHGNLCSPEKSSQDSDYVEETNTPERRDKTSADRLRMPPPATPSQERRIRQRIQKTMTTSVVTPETDQDAETDVSFHSTATGRRKADYVDDYDMEQARRRAAAVQLPENSGIWTQGERDLFYHLALRGFEVLLPHNWMVDFKTLPLSLFATEISDSAPIVHHIQGTEFRAIRALRELIDTGKSVRDKSLSSPGFHAENTLARAIQSYIVWALSDAGMHHDQLSTITPVHIVVTKKKGQKTADTLTELTIHLHNLAAQHRSLHGIIPSIEHCNNSPTTKHQGTKVYDEDDGLPILTGLMIVSSVLAIFTLNAHTPMPASLRNPTRQQNKPNSSGDKPTTPHTTSNSEESGLRFIATFDFSDPALDVWNALSVAIVTMHIRKMMLENSETDGKDGSAASISGISEANTFSNKRRKTDDPDA